MKRLAWVFTLLLMITNIACAQDIRRCLKTDGTVTFTDKSCTESETEKLIVPQTTIINSNKKKIFIAPPICNKKTEDLLYSVRIAIEAHDANQLAKNYHWINVSNQQANIVFNRLEKIVTKPLIDIRLLQAIETLHSEQIPDTDPNLDMPSNTQTVSHSYALKVIQSDKSTSNQHLSTIFNLQRNYGCYWIRF